MFQICNKLFLAIHTTLPPFKWGSSGCQLVAAVWKWWPEGPEDTVPQPPRLSQQQVPQQKANSLEGA